MISIGNQSVVIENMISPSSNISSPNPIKIISKYITFENNLYRKGKKYIETIFRHQSSSRLVIVLEL